MSTGLISNVDYCFLILAKNIFTFVVFCIFEASRDIYYAAVVYKSFHGMLPDKMSKYVIFSLLFSVC